MTWFEFWFLPLVTFFVCVITFLLIRKLQHYERIFLLIQRFLSDREASGKTATERISALKSCPFCGSNAEILNLSSSHKGTFFAHCPSCLIGTLACDIADDASALWNKRISEKQEQQP